MYTSFSIDLLSLFDAPPPREPMQITKNYAVYLWLTFLACACLCYLRAPDLFYDPRIWAEGGSVYLPQALEEGFLRNLFSTKLGYYSLFNNLSYSVITLFDLEYTASLSAAFFFFAILTTVSLALWLPMQGFLSRWLKYNVLVPFTPLPFRKYKPE